MPVRALAFGDRLNYAGGRLEVDPGELAALCRRDRRLTDVRFAIASPGERTRLIHVLDVFAPAARFPGITDSIEGTGRGRRLRLEGMAVTICCAFPRVEHGHSVKEAILDLSGPGARLSPLSALHHLVLLPTPRPDLDLADSCAAVRAAGIAVARHLAAAVAPNPDDGHWESLDLIPVHRSLPRIVHIAALAQEGPLHGVHLYGQKLGETPVWLHPNDWTDSAVVNASYHIAACRTSTYHYQNNPLPRVLRHRHGSDLDFVGTVAVRCCIVGECNKERTAWLTGELAAGLGAHGAVLTIAGGGHGYADLHLICQQCERRGVRTVLVQSELGDDDGSDTALVSFVPEADAIVSTGNQDEVVQLPAVDRVIGGDAWSADDAYEPPLATAPQQPLTTALRRLLSATEQSGSGRVRGQRA